MVMAQTAIKLVPVEDYLAQELVAKEKHEYFDGEVFCMAGASISHNRIVVNLTTAIDSFLKGKGCDLYPSDMRVATPTSDAYMYPDLSIVCGSPELKEGTFDTLTNPSVIFEIKSPSTKTIDFGNKFFFYKKIPSMQEYFLIDPTAYTATKFTKQIDGSWNIIELFGAETILHINTISLDIPFSNIYYRVMI